MRIWTEERVVVVVEKGLERALGSERTKHLNAVVLVGFEEV